MSFFLSGGRWFSFEMTFCPVCASSAFLAFQATAHHSLEACCISFHQVLSFFFMISVVEASPSIVNIVSRSVMWSRRLSDFFVSHLYSLYSLGVIPKVAREIWAVSMPYCRSSTHRVSHSSVRSFRTAIPRIRLSIHSLLYHFAS